jgi:hypothetical protein
MASGSDIPRVCDRPGCSRPAAARLVIDVRHLVVTVDDRLDDVGGAAQLCAKHAERIIPPRGWTVDDHFNLRPRLFQMEAEADPDPAAAPAEPTGRIRRVRKRLGADEQLLLEPGAPYELPEGYAEVPGNGSEPNNRDEHAATDRPPPEHAGSTTYPARPGDAEDPPELEPDATVNPMLARAFEHVRAQPRPGLPLPPGDGP